MDDITKLSLVEKHSISPEFAYNKNEIGAIAINDDENICILLNSQDHIEIQVFNSGMELESTFNLAREIDNKFEEIFDIAVGKDENDNVINPTSEVTIRKNGKYFTDYTVKFSKEGSYKLTPCYIYHSGEVQVRDNILNVNVFSENYYGGSYLISDTDVNLGDTFTIKQYVPAKMHYYYYDSEGNELTPVSYDYKYESTGTYAYITFRTTKLGLNQKFTCKASHAYAPYGRMDVNQEIAINVCKNI